MLVRRHPLGRELAADPVGLFDHDHPTPERAGGEGGGASTSATTYDQYVAA
jgi:hypothetical protein